MFFNISKSEANNINLDMKEKVFKMFFALEDKAFKRQREQTLYSDYDFIRNMIAELIKICVVAGLSEESNSPKSFRDVILEGEYKNIEYSFKLSCRQQSSFIRSINCLLKDDVPEAIHALYEFLDDYGNYRLSSEFSFYEKSVALALINNIINYLERKLPECNEIILF